MALILADRVRETTTTVGTGAFALGGAQAGFQAFSAVLTNGDTTYYACAGTSEWEVGIGTWNTGNTLSRTTILASSNGGSIVNFSAGAKDIFISYPASRSVYQNEAGTSTVQQAFSSLSATSANITTATITSGTVSTTPASGNDIANKTYVDTTISSGITYHSPVKYEVPNSTGNLNAIYNQPGGPGVGVGATLTNNGTLAAFAPDGPTAAPGDRILVYNQTNAFENGVYTVTTVGNGSTPWVLTRATDADTYAVKSPNGLGLGDAFFITSGNTGAGETYVCNTSGTITFGTTAINFVQVSSAQIYSAGTGLTLSGTQFSITNTGVGAATYGSASSVPVIGVNAQGQITSATNTTIAITGAQVSGNIAGSAGSVANALTAGSYLTSGGTYDGSVARTFAVDADTANTASKVVARDASGNFSAGTITASLSGNATSANTSTNISGGTANQIPYQASAGTTTFIAAPTTANTYLSWTGSAYTWAATGTFTSATISGSLTLSGGTANGVAYLNGSKVLTTGSALTFDGTTLKSQYFNVQDFAASNDFVLAFKTNAGTQVGYVGVVSSANNLSLTSTNSLIFSPSNTEQARLTSTGLGIGTSSPAYKLDVQTSAGRFQVQNYGAGSVLLYSNGALAYNAATTRHEWQVAGSSLMQLEASGNLGLGVTPSAWNLSAGLGNAIDLNYVGSIASVGSITGLGTEIGRNYFYNGTNYTYKANGAASRYRQGGGIHNWETAASGIAGATFASFTNLMTLDASGNLGVGTTTIGSRVTIGDPGTGLSFTNAASGNFNLGLLAGTGSADAYVYQRANNPLIFGTNNTERARITSGGTFQTSLDASIYGVTVGRGAGAVSTNTAVGASALAANTSGGNNTSVGSQSLLLNTTGTGATAIGRNSMQNNDSGNDSTAVGRNSLFSNTTGSNNVAIGKDSLYLSTTASNNTAVGYQAGYSNTTATNNTFVGYQAGYSGITANSVTAIGWSALKANTAGKNTAVGAYVLIANTSGTHNVAVGGDDDVSAPTMYYNTTGSYNSAFGNATLASNTTGSNNTAVGRQALQANTTASNNTAVGYQAGYANQTGTGIDAFGYNALKNTTVSYNAGFGLNALVTNTTGSYNIAMGTSSLQSNTTGSNNIAVGFQALINNTTASNNTAVGYQAAYNNITGTGITAIGYRALLSSTASYNTAVGSDAGYNNTTGARNTFIGQIAGYNTNTGTANVFIGSVAAYGNTTGSYNTAIGGIDGGTWGVFEQNSTGSYNTVIGAGALKSNTTANFNTAIGYEAGFSNTTGSITVFGMQAGYSNTAGVYNTFIGGWDSTNFSAGFGTTTGAYNTALGAGSLAKNTTASNNTAVGYQAGYTNTTGIQLVAVGRQAAYSHSNGSRNTAVGDQALYNTTSPADNTAIGTYALLSNSTGGSNTAVGSQSLYSNTTAGQNTAIGTQALYSNTTGSVNVAAGFQALYSNTTAAYNYAFGYQALYVNTTGVENNAHGWRALYLNTTGGNNCAFGNGALYNNTTAGTNTALGNYALYLNATGDSLVAVGYNAGYATTASYNTFVGAYVGRSNTSGNFNVAVGSNGPGNPTFYLNTTGSYNSVLGVRALAVNTTGSYNTAIGEEALQANTTSNGNTALGYQAGYSTTTVGANTFIGHSAGYSNTGSYNVFVGYQAGYGNTTGTNNTFVGTFVSGLGGSGYLVTTGSKNTILGAYSGNQGGLDIRTASNYIVLSDGDGNPRAYWNGANATFGGSLQTTSFGVGTAPSGTTGEIRATNNITAYYSDERLKTRLGLIDNALDKLLSLEGFYYEANEVAQALGYTPVREVGVSAQAVQKILPEVVAPAPINDKYLTVRYEKLIPLLIEAVKELKFEFDTVKAELATIKGA